MQIRKASERGHFKNEWLDSYHTFSFGEYFDPKHMGFKTLRVINEDVVAPGAGFPTHPHQNMEIVTYVLSGELAHKDSMGNGSVIKPGDVQRMTAGTGVTHSEFNNSQESPVHLLQIWILPNQQSLKPGYEEIRFNPEQKHNRLCLVASPQGHEGTVKIHQDAYIYASLLGGSHAVEHRIEKGRGVWVQAISGVISVDNILLSKGDALSIINEEYIKIAAEEDAEFLLFDLK
ncbi:pirin family protein [bacterium]|nr:pirin family protein [bacterium]